MFEASSNNINRNHSGVAFKKDAPEFSGIPSKTHINSTSPDKTMISMQFEKSPAKSSASPQKRSGKKATASSSTKKRRVVDENDVEGSSPVKYQQKSSPLKTFMGKSPTKKQMMLCKHAGDEPDCDDEISPFKEENINKRGSLLESLEQISFGDDDDDNLLRTESVQIHAEPETNLLKERKRQAQDIALETEQVVHPDIESILELDVPIINYGSYISTKVLGSTL